MAAAEAGAAVAADGVDLVDEDDAGGVALRLVEQVAHAGGADADEHLDELGAADGEEGHAGLAGDGLGEKRLAGAGRADEEDALGNAGAQGGELLRELKELHDLRQLFLRLVHAGDVHERHAGTGAAEHPGAALTEVHRLGVASLGLSQEEEEDGDYEDDGQELEEEGGDVAPEAVLLDLDGREVLRVYAGVLEHLAGGIALLHLGLEGLLVALELIGEVRPVDLNALNPVGLGVLNEPRERPVNGA